MISLEQCHLARATTISASWATLSQSITRKAWKINQDSVFYSNRVWKRTDWTFPEKKLNTTHSNTKESSRQTVSYCTNKLDVLQRHPYFWAVDLQFILLESAEPRLSTLQLKSICNWMTLCFIFKNILEYS